MPTSLFQARPQNLKVPLSPNEELRAAKKLGAGLLQGPEDVAINELGEIFTGTADGYVKKLLDGTIEAFSYLGGHPLGMDFDAAGIFMFVNLPLAYFALILKAWLS